MTNPTLDALIKARGYVERGWTQGANARGKSGRALANVTSRYAVCWCIVGALDTASDWDRYLLTRRAIGETLGSDSLTHWNDEPGRTKAQVLALFDRAIEAQSSKGGV